jgi:hypothetical protein
MLAPLSGSIHLSVAAGCGGTTLGLQYAREVLTRGNHVVWICDEMPDGERFSQIFCELSPVAVAKFHLSAVGENTEIGIKSAIDLLSVMKNISLVVVDDWTGKTGRTASDLRNSVQNLIAKCSERGVVVIAISSAYEGADGSGWKARGGLKGCETWFLHRGQVDSMYRELHIQDTVTEYILSDEGFTLRK